jgi:hypothetical protein
MRVTTSSTLQQPLILLSRPIDKTWKLSYIYIITFPYIHVNTSNRHDEQFFYCDRKSRFVPLYTLIQRD